MNRSYFKGAAAAFALVAVSAVGQVTSGNIAGVVKDSSGAVIPNAAVSIKSESTGVVVTGKTNGSGEYLIQNLLPSRYDVDVIASGFSASSIKGVTVNLNSTATADIAMNTGQQATTVEVSASSADVLDTTTQNLTTSFSNEELAILPTATIGFGVLNASLLAPNVAAAGGIGIGEGPSVGGQRPRNNNYMIEGIDNNDKGVTGPLVYVPNDAVGNFTLITNQFSPEFGHSSGGQFNTDVLSGTNSVHGRVYEYFENRNLNAAGGIAGGKIPNPRFDFNRYGGEVGGPIIKNKLFGFVNFERQTTGQNLSGYLCTPTAAGLATLQGLAGPYGLNANNLAQYAKYTPAATANGGAQVNTATDNACFNPPDASGNQSATVTAGTTLNNNTGLYESGASTNIPLGNYLVSAPVFTNFDALTTSGDYTISQADTLRLRYIFNTEGTQDTAANLPAFYQTLPYRYHLIAISEFHNFTPNLVNEVRVGYNRFYNITPSGNFTFPGLDQFPSLYIGDQDYLEYGPDPNAPQSTVQNLYQAVDNISYTKGKHTLKFGFDGRKYISPQTFTQRVRGDYEWNALSEYLHDLAPTSFGQRSTGNFIYYGDQTALYGYGNDTWRLTPKLTVNYGLRYEFTSVPVGERAQSLNIAASVPGLITFGTPQPAYKNFAPRIGISYAPDAKTVIRTGFGIAYDVLFDNLGLLSFPPQYSSTNSVGDGNINYTGKINPNPGDPNFLTNGGLPPGNGGLATFTSIAAQRAATAAFVPNQVTPYAESYSLQIERSFASSYTASVQYIGTRGIHLPTQDQINVQPKVTAANQLFTSLNSASTVNTGAGVSTLANLNKLSAIVPAYAAAGLTGKLTSYQPYSSSNYNGLGLNLSRHFQHGFQANVSYTFSRTMDDATAEVFATVLTPRRPQNSQNVAADYSRSALDATHRLTAEAVYDLPFFKHSNFLLKNTLGNWEVSPIYTYQSPEYATVLSGDNANLNTDSGAAIDRTIINPNGVKGTSSKVTGVYSSNPTLVALCGTGVTQCTADLVGYTAVNPNAYYIQAGLGTLPNASRNTLPIRPIDNFDLSALKRINFTDRYAFEFQAEAFNVLNHAQYIPGSVDTINAQGFTSNYNFQTVGSNAFGQAQKIFSNNPRVMQLTAKLLF